VQPWCGTKTFYLAPLLTVVGYAASVCSASSARTVLA
jgi:hypothetical protein